ncbi:MAG: hypothetical protein AB7P33_09810 [Dehalococcoidia bacterium]
MADVIGKRIKGNLVYIDRSAHMMRVIDAIGPDVIKHELRASDAQPDGSTATQPTGWTTTLVETGLGGESYIEASELPGYVWDIVTDNAENDGVNTQLVGRVFELTSDQVLYAGLEFKINDVTQTDFFFGLAVTDTDILGGVTDRVGFESLDGSTAVGFMVEKDSSETKASSLATLVDDTLMYVEFYWDGSALSVFIDGDEVTGPALTNLPNDESLRLSIHFLTGETTANTMSIRQGRIIQIGR